MYLARTARCLPLSLLLCASPALGQSAPAAAPALASAQYVPVCEEAPREDAMVSLCAPPTSAEELRAAEVEPAAPAIIPLTLSAGTPLRIAVEQRARIHHPGEVIHGKIVETVYAFDQVVIPAGSVATGHVKSIAPVPGVRRTMAYANGDFSPFRKYEVSFDSVTLPDGRQLPITTTVTPGTAQVVHLVSNPDRQQQKGAAGRATDRAKSEAKGKIAEAKGASARIVGKVDRARQNAPAERISAGAIALSAAIPATRDAVCGGSQRAA